MDVKRFIQIALLAILLPLTGNAREETLEARKKRIMRKYLKESSEIVQSDMVVPGDEQEEEQVLDSEKFQEPDLEFERHQGRVVPPRLPPRQAMVQRDSEHWMLSDIEDEEDSFDQQESKDDSSDYWSMFEPRDDSSAYGSDRKALSYGQDRYDAYSRSRLSGYDVENEDSATTRSAFGFGRDRQFRQEDYGRAGQEDIFGRAVQDPVFADPAQLSPQRTYGASPDSGLLLQTPFPQARSTEADLLREDRTQQGYIPYKSIQQMDDERTERWGNQGSSEQQIYIKPNMYQQYKERNKSWEPTADDAYLDEMIRKAHGR